MQSGVVAGYGSPTEITAHSTGRTARQREGSSRDGYRGAWQLPLTCGGLTNPSIRMVQRNATVHALNGPIPAADAPMEGYATAASASARAVQRTAMVSAQYRPHAVVGARGTEYAVMEDAFVLMVPGNVNDRCIKIAECCGGCPYWKICDNGRCVCPPGVKVCSDPLPP
jgi:hypothetical protein